MKYVSDIFNERPETWGLRSDPDFWDYLCDYYRRTELPYSVEELEKTILEQFKLLTGSSPMNDERYFVEQFAQVHKGMSTGYVSSFFWLQKAIPLLKSRLAMANDQFHK